MVLLNVEDDKMTAKLHETSVMVFLFFDMLLSDWPSGNLIIKNKKIQYYNNVVCILLFASKLGIVMNTY